MVSKYYQADDMHFNSRFMLLVWTELIFQSGALMKCAPQPECRLFAIHIACPMRTGGNANWLPRARYQVASPSFALLYRLDSGYVLG